MIVSFVELLKQGNRSGLQREAMSKEKAEHAWLPTSIQGGKCINSSTTCTIFWMETNKGRSPFKNLGAKLPLYAR